MNSKDAPSDVEIRKALSLFASAIIENLQQSQTLSSDAFTGYEMQLRGEIHKDKKEFTKRFVNGYFALNS